MASKTEAEEKLRESAHLAGPDPWHEIESASARERALYLDYSFLENGAGFNSGLFRDARLLLRGADERTRPNADRLREFTDASLPAIQRELYAQVPVYPELEVLTLSLSLERMREWLGPDHPVVRRLLSKESPESLAARLIAETKLDDAVVRKQLWQGGKAAVDASLDPMIEFARAVDPEARAVRKRFEDRGRSAHCGLGAKNCRRPFQGLRDECLSGCHVHAAPQLRHRARLGRKRLARRTIHLSRPRLRARHRRLTFQNPRSAG